MENGSAVLQALFDKDWQWEMIDNPEFASQSGDYNVVHEKGKELQCLSVAAYERRAQHSRDMVAEVSDILAKYSLTPRQTLFANLFKNGHSELAEFVETAPLYLLPLNSVGAGCITFNFTESVEWMRFESVADFEIYRNKLIACRTQVDETIEVMREGIKRGFVCSAAQVHGMSEQLDGLVAGDFPELMDPLSSDSGLEILASAPELLLSIQAEIANFKKYFLNFVEFFNKEYTPVLREHPGCSSLPNGQHVYAQCLKYHTTTNLTAEEVHQIGLAEVANIEQRYRNEVLPAAGYAPDDMENFVKHVKSAPEFYVSTTEELLDAYRKECADIYKEMPKFFEVNAKSTMEITSRNGGPAAYYLAGTADGKRPGRFYVNVSHLSERPLTAKVALALHEGVPGHHHQLSIALENETVPAFMRFIEDRRYECCPCRRNLYTGYAEGWGLYCEFLGEEMGMYKTPYDLFGRLSMDMMRAVRCVVDTGMHAFDWSIEKCIDYMMAKTGMHRHEVETEIYRYSAWPGQACAYKVGQQEIVRLRRHAENKLGDKFNLPRFHSLVLNTGAVPLSQLAVMVDEFIAAGGELA